MITRRQFLKAFGGAGATLALPSKLSYDWLTPKPVSFDTVKMVGGYNSLFNYYWIRVSVSIAHGQREFHDAIRFDSSRYSPGHEVICNAVNTVLERSGLTDKRISVDDVILVLKKRGSELGFH